jgi:hypothetical protein
MANRVYNKAMIEFLTKHYKTEFLPDLTKMFNKEFGEKKTVSQIKACLNNHGIKAGVKRNRTLRLYTNEHLAWIEKTYQDLNIPRMTKAFNEKFKMNVTVNSMRACTRNHGFKSGRNGRFEKGQESWNKGKKGLQLGGEAGWFKPGHMPINHKPLGSERVNVYGYIEVKTCEPNKWELKHRVIWEKHNESLLPGEMVCFKDNNKLNCSIDNLFLSNQQINGSMNKMGYYKFTGELKQSAVALTKLKLKTKEFEL